MSIVCVFIQKNVAGPILSFVFGLIFSGIPLVFFTYLFNLCNKNYEEFFNVFLNFIILIFFALFFFVVGIWILIEVLKSAFKKPPKYIAKLTRKTKEKYNGIEVISMTFQVDTGTGICSYECYTKKDNDFMLEETYIIKIRELDDKVIAVLPYDSDDKIDNNYKIPTIDREKKEINLPVVGVIFVIAGPIIMIWLKVIFDIINKTGLVNKYDGEFFFALISGTIFAILITIAGKKFISNTNKEEKKDNDINFAKYPILEETETFIANPIRKMRIREMKLILICWFFMELLMICTMNIKSADFSITEDLVPVIIVFSFPLLGLEIVEFILLCKDYNLDKKSLEMYNVNVNNLVTLNNIRSFKIIRVLQKPRNAEIYYIIDDKRNLLFKIIEKVWSNTYCIIGYSNKKIGEISKKIFSLENTYIIRLIGKNPIAVKSRLGVNYDYDVYNVNYKVVGNYVLNEGYNAMSSTICENDKDVAYIQFLSSKKFLYHFSSAEVSIVEDVKNKEEIIFIAMSVVLGNQGRFNLEIDR